MKENYTLYKKLISHYNSNPVSFHVPGHKMGQGFNPIGETYFKDILKIDMTEIKGLDDLHQPQGVILEAEKRAANVFKADHTFFLVNGSTVGNFAMILATCQPGDKIIVQRNLHKSVINAMMLARVKPVYLVPEIIAKLGIPGSITLEQIRESLKHHSDAKAVFLTNPNYYGLGIDLTEITNLVHQHNIPLLIDEAHGAHFGFHSKLPGSAIGMGADMVVQSTHKTLSAMTMGSMLHIKSKLIDVDRVKFFLSMLQTSSPSYPIMASLDLATQWIEAEGENLWNRPIEMINWLNYKGSSLKSIELITKELNNYYYHDPLKIIIHSLDKGLTGFTIQEMLIKKGVFPEFADIYNVLAIVTTGTDIKDIEKLYAELAEIDKQNFHIINKNEQTEDNTDLLGFFPIFQENESLVSLESILYGKTEKVLFNDAIGKIAAEMVIPYPPGIPLLQLGEIITKDVIEYLKILQEKGVGFQGISDPNLKYIKVLA